MYSIDILILTGAAALLVGLAVGALLARQLSPNARRQRGLKPNLDQLTQQQEDYRHEVAEHFAETAKLLDALAEGHRNLHSHLAKGADSLCNDDGILQSPPGASAAEPPSQPQTEAVQPPLDYAPKASPHATGVLNEEFGLDKNPAGEKGDIIGDGQVPHRA